MQTSTIIRVDGKDFELGYPNVGQKLEIENYKLIYSFGSYPELIKNTSKTGVEMLDIVDAISYIKVLNQDLFKHLKIGDSFDTIDLSVTIKLRKIVKEYSKWYMTFEKEMYDFLEKEVEEA